MKLEAENYQRSSIFRQSASQDKTVPLREYQFIEMTFCLRRSTDVSVLDVHYTNDGPENIIRLSFDRRVIGQEISHNNSRKGELWNVIYSTGRIGEPEHLNAGLHKLQVHIVPVMNRSTRDKWGIEIDAVYLEIDDNDINHNYLYCRNTMCDGKITYIDRHRDHDNIPSGKLVQLSRASTCLEEDNIKMPIYHESVKQFRISALPPRYRTFWTFNTAQFEGCPVHSRFHWQYMGVRCGLGNEEKDHRHSVMHVVGSRNTSGNCLIVISFDLEGMAYGKTDAHIGDVLEIEVESSTNMTIQPKFGILNNGTFDYQDKAPKTLTPSSSSTSWEFPDFTWRQLEEDHRYVNQILFEVSYGTLFSYIRLERRNETPQVETKIYDNVQTQIHKVELDYWWRDPAIRAGQESRMEVFVDTPDGQINKGFAHYIRVLEKRVWSPSGDMDQTFVLYQDGSARILPIVPHGLDSYVPFGNDIVIGNADPSHVRPHSPIKKLVIHPVTHFIDVYYNDGGFATLHLFSSMEGTNVTVTNITFSGDYKQKPFAIFRSTWVEDGRAKVDHVTVNGLPAKHVLLDSWRELYGTNFIFFRRCISMYNSQSPDYSLEILSDTEVN